MLGFLIDRLRPRPVRRCLLPSALPKKRAKARSTDRPTAHRMQAEPGRCLSTLVSGTTLRAQMDSSGFFEGCGRADATPQPNSAADQSSSQGTRPLTDHSGFVPQRCCNAEFACESPAVDSLRARAAASASPGALISISSRAAAVSRNSKGATVPQVLYEAPASTALVVTTDPNLVSTTLRSPAANLILAPAPIPSKPVWRK